MAAYLVAVAMDISQICLTGYATGVQNEVEDFGFETWPVRGPADTRKGSGNGRSKEKGQCSRLKTFLQ